MYVMYVIGYTPVSHVKHVWMCMCVQAADHAYSYVCMCVYTTVKVCVCIPGNMERTMSINMLEPVWMPTCVSADMSLCVRCASPCMCVLICVYATMCVCVCVCAER